MVYTNRAVLENILLKAKYGSFRPKITTIHLQRFGFVVRPAAPYSFSVHFSLAVMLFASLSP